MRKEGLSPSKNPKIKKKLLFNNLLTDHIGKRITLTDKIVKKYRCSRMARRLMGTKWAPLLGVINEKKKERIRIKQ